MSEYNGKKKMRVSFRGAGHVESGAPEMGVRVANDRVAYWLSDLLLGAMLREGKRSSWFVLFFSNCLTGILCASTFSPLPITFRHLALTIVPSLAKVATKKEKRQHRRRDSRTKKKPQNT